MRERWAKQERWCPRWFKRWIPIREKIWAARFLTVGEMSYISRKKKTLKRHSSVRLELKHNNSWFERVKQL